MSSLCGRKCPNPNWLTWTIDTQSIASIGKNFTSGGLYGSLRKPFFATDNFDELQRDALEKCKNLLSVVPLSAPRSTFFVFSIRVTHLRSVSAGNSKLFCAFSSAMRSSLAASSSWVGRIVEIGGVTPHCRAGGVAIMIV